MKSFNTFIVERADTWHPDPEQDRKLGGPGANQRAREDRAAASKPKEDPKKLKPGESYMDYAKRHGYRPRNEAKVTVGNPFSEAKVDKEVPDYERSGVRNKRYDNKTGAHALGGGIQRARRAEHEEKRGVKKEEVEYTVEDAKQRLIAKYKKLRDAKSKPGKVYDPLKDSSFDHDKAEKTRGQSGTYSKEEVEYTVEDAKMGKQSDEKLSAMHKQFSSMDQSSPANQFMLNRVQKEINRRKKPVKNQESEIEEGKQSFPLKKVQNQMSKALKGSVYAKKGNPGPVPNTTDSEKKETTRFSKMHHAFEKAKRENQEVDKARRSPTFYKDTHPASAPKMKKANESLSFADFMESRRMDEENSASPEAIERINKLGRKIAAKQAEERKTKKPEKPSGMQSIGNYSIPGANPNKSYSN